jgi:hypothetical protein
MSLVGDLPHEKPKTGYLYIITWYRLSRVRKMPIVLPYESTEVGPKVKRCLEPRSICVPKKKVYLEVLALVHSLAMASRLVKIALLP